ncbi:TLD domain-containing protein 1-like isoform X1 [Pocillopora damicornis]|uniref:TLD domain-containing protein 1-like isoform X1 n=1 Tax=Pocillopora damicornis TaxID=46731 RepID=UPI000F555BE6|nr:TLD domain-containing protein 1-like isoform X1 [Pocillopora damicornis]
MGILASKGIEYEDSYRSFSEKERQHLLSLFNQLATANDLGVMKVEFEPLKNHLAWLLPECVISRFFKEMCNIQRARRVVKNPLEDGQVGRVAFFVSMSHVFKRSKAEKGQIFYHLTADVDQVVTSVEVEELCKILLDAYVMALKKTTDGAKWELHTNAEANHRFAKNAIQELLEKKADPSCVSPEEVISWFSKFPLIEKLFLAVMRAGFFDVESLLEAKPHGLEEGCEETVAHVQYDRSHIIMPCKFEVDFNKVDSLLDIPSIILLNHHLPQSSQHQWRLLFSTQTHGESFSAFIHQITNQGPMIIVARDTGGHIFGGFASVSWSIKSHFVGDSYCFLFSLKPKMGVYHPTGYNENFMYLNMGMQTMPNGLGMGGQLNYFGFWLNEDFGSGHSRGQPSCTTYGSPVLSAEEEFKLDRLEAWGVGVPPENEAGVSLAKSVIFCLLLYKRVIFIGLATGLLVRFRAEGKGEIVGS